MESEMEYIRRKKRAFLSLFIAIISAPIGPGISYLLFKDIVPGIIVGILFGMPFMHNFYMFAFSPINDAIQSMAESTFVSQALTPSDIQETATNDVNASSDFFKLLDPPAFEMLVQGLVQRMGLEIREKLQTDDGPLLLAYDPQPVNGGYVLVKCLHTESVELPEVQALSEKLSQHNAFQGWFFTSGDFTQDAWDLGEVKPVHTINRRMLAKLLNEYKNS